MNERYAGLVNNFDNYAYHFLGCGAIGSAAAVTMVKMGAKCIHLYDMDKVERPNVGVSVYDTNDINKDKVSALKDRLLLIDPYLEVHKKPDVLIDGRMGAEHYQQYTFKNPTLSQYKKTWYSDSEGDDEPCNAKATSYCSSMTGSFICNNVKKILKDEPYLNNFSFNFQTMALNSNGFVS